MHQKSTKQIKVSLPDYLLDELDGMIEEGQQSANRNEFIHQATEMYLKERQRLEFQEAMKQGYEEMSSINLNIAAESFQAETEVDHSLNRRLLSGI
ncbi:MULTISPECIES: CopG family ribbon-helix-helix protein [Marinococcus]|uniref:CopG family ribbon-helix-helix protein n=1 Tax=Marinococcus TaxID=1370 RepID=UPI0003B5623A|nr:MULTISPECIES: hypothetical protein [Marinococcus]MDX6153742.1 antitoxin [Marinococcus sp. PL1-022]